MYMYMYSDSDSQFRASTRVQYILQSQRAPVHLMHVCGLVRNGCVEWG